MPLDKFIINVYCEIKDLSPVSGAANTCVLMQAITGLKRCALCRRLGYIAHVKGRGQEAGELQHNPAKKARRWVVTVAHSWFNRFLAFNLLTAAIIAFRKVPLTTHIIYG